MPKTTSPLDATLQQPAAAAAEDMLHRIARTGAWVEPFVSLLDRLNALPIGSDEKTMEERSQVLDEAFARFATYLTATGELADALLHATTSRRKMTFADSCLATAVRIFFLEPKRQYTHADLRTLFSETLADNAVSFSGDPREPKETAVLSWNDAVISVLSTVRAATLEDALGDEADRVLPAGYRTRVVRLLLPNHVVADLEDKAAKSGLPDIAAVIENQYGRGDEPIEPQWNSAKRHEPSSLVTLNRSRE